MTLQESEQNLLCAARGLRFPQCSQRFSSRVPVMSCASCSHNAPSRVAGFRRWGRRVYIPERELEQFVNNLEEVTVSEAISRAEVAR